MAQSKIEQGSFTDTAISRTLLAEDEIPTAKATVAFSGLNFSLYRRIEVILETLIFSVDDQTVQLRVHDGTVFKSTAGDYAWLVAMNLTTGRITEASNSATFILLNGTGTDQGVNLTTSMNGKIDFLRTALSTSVTCVTQTNYFNNAGTRP